MRRDSFQQGTERGEGASRERMYFKDAIAFLRERGPYSNTRLQTDLAALCSEHEAEDIRTTAQAYAENTRKGIPRMLIETLAERQLPPAPAGYLALDALRAHTGVGYEPLKELIRKYLRIKGIDLEEDDVLTDQQAYQRYPQLKEIFIFARGSNGIGSTYFTPKAQETLLHMAQESQRDAHVASVTGIKKTPPRPSRSQVPAREKDVRILPHSRETGFEVAVLKLKTRLEVILEDLSQPDERLAREILAALTPSITPQEADAYAKQIAVLETKARHNRDED